jgi:hypothetical protein
LSTSADTPCAFSAGTGPGRRVFDATRAQVDAEVARRAGAKALRLDEVPVELRRYYSVPTSDAPSEVYDAARRARQAGWSTWYDGGTADATRWRFTAPDGRSVVATRAELAASLPLLLGDVPEGYRRWLVTPGVATDAVPGARAARNAGWYLVGNEGPEGAPPTAYVIKAPDGRTLRATVAELAASLPAVRAFELGDVPDDCMAWVRDYVDPKYPHTPDAARIAAPWDVYRDGTERRVGLRAAADGPWEYFAFDEVRAFLAARNEPARVAAETPDAIERAAKEKRAKANGHFVEAQKYADAATWTVPTAASVGPVATLFHAARPVDGATGQTTTEAAMDNGESMLETVIDDVSDAAMRTAGTQFVRLAREPLVALLQRHLGADDDALRGKIATFLETEVGASMLAAMLSAGLSAMPGVGGVGARLARELRVRAMADAGSLVADVLTGPLMAVLTTTLRGTAPVTATPAALGEPARVPFAVVDAAKATVGK